MEGYTTALLHCMDDGQTHRLEFFSRDDDHVIDTGKASYQSKFIIENGSPISVAELYNASAKKDVQSIRGPVMGYFINLFGTDLRLQIDCDFPEMKREPGKRPFVYFDYSEDQIDLAKHHIQKIYRFFEGQKTNKGIEENAKEYIKGPELEDGTLGFIMS